MRPLAQFPRPVEVAVCQKRARWDAGLAAGRDGMEDERHLDANRCVRTGPWWGAVLVAGRAGINAQTDAICAVGEVLVGCAQGERLVNS